MDRIILHCDMNNFYASVECLLHPELQNKYIAVCGSLETRHGIVLAKNELAKALGVKTGEPIWQAKVKCPQLTVVHPHYDEYIRFSRLAQEIYYRYTDLIEPFGPDECWLDVTGSKKLFGNGKKIADLIRRDIKNELGLTISVGVSFNKVFAKLGSDIKKPNATTVISRENFKDKIFDMPVGELLYVGTATSKKLSRYGINTIGQLAESSPIFLQKILGKTGLTLHTYANGLENSPVNTFEFEIPLKSVSHGVTTVRDLRTAEEVWCVILDLTQDIGHKLRNIEKLACSISLSIRCNDLSCFSRQCKIQATRSPMSIAKAAQELFVQCRNNIPIRSITITAQELIPDTFPVQHSLFCDISREQKLDKLDTVIDDIRIRFGNDAIKNAVLCRDIGIPPHKTVIMPKMPAS